MRIEEPQSKCTIYCLLIICRSRSDVPQVPQVKEQGHLLPITVSLSFPDRSDHVSDDHGVMMIMVLIILVILIIVIPAVISFGALMTDFVSIIVIMAIIMMYRKLLTRICDDNGDYNDDDR